MAKASRDNWRKRLDEARQDLIDKRDDARTEMTPEALLEEFRASRAYEKLLEDIWRDRINNAPRGGAEGAAFVKQVTRELRDTTTELTAGENASLAALVLDMLKNGDYDQETIDAAYIAASDYLEAVPQRQAEEDDDYKRIYYQASGEDPAPGLFDRTSPDRVKGSIKGAEVIPGSIKGAEVIPGSIKGREDIKGTIGDPRAGSPALRKEFPKQSQRSQHVLVDNTEERANVDGAPAWATPDVVPGANYNQSAAAGAAIRAASNSVNEAAKAYQNGVLPAGSYTRNMVNTGQYVFLGYTNSRSSRGNEDDPKGGRIYTDVRTPNYQNLNALDGALGRDGFPSIKEFQKKMQLPVTGYIDANTYQMWQNTLQMAAINTKFGINMTVTQAMNNQAAAIADALRRQRAAMGAAYGVDETAAAAVLGGTMKQMLGRLSTAAEDKAFREIFNRRNISTQGKVDAAQLARDYIREHYPTEAGTAMTQDYYGAMYDVLNSGPGSLGQQAVSVDG